MIAKSVLHYENLVAVFGCFALIGILYSRKLAKTYAFLTSLLVVRGVMAIITVAILYHRKQLGLEIHEAYDLYFYCYWTSAALQMVLQLGLVYSVYRIAMKPMEGLRNLGGIVFAWAASVSLVLSIAVAFGPHWQSNSVGAKLISQAQQGEGVLTMCLLLFVTFAARPLGLKFRSHAFGTLLGLGFSSTASLVLSSWASTAAGMSLYSPLYAWGSAIGCATVMIWGVYFALPEPERALVLLPTTSPYFHWNAVSEALRVAPGVVAVSGFTPKMMAPAEMAALTSAKQQMALPSRLPEAEMRSLRSVVAR